MIEEMASSYWRLRRGWAIESSLMNEALARQPQAQDGKAEVARIAAAFTELAGTPQFHLLHRYESRLHNIFQRSMYNLILLRTPELPSKPSPISGQVEAPVPLAPHPRAVLPRSATIVPLIVKNRTQHPPNLT